MIWLKLDWNSRNLSMTFRKLIFFEGHNFEASTKAYLIKFFTFQGFFLLEAMTILMSDETKICFMLHTKRKRYKLREKTNLWMLQDNDGFVEQRQF